MSVSTLSRPVSAPSEAGHVHTRTCYWDHLECRWACPGPAPVRLPEPRTPPEA